LGVENAKLQDRPVKEPFARGGWGDVEPKGTPIKKREKPQKNPTESKRQVSGAAEGRSLF